MPNKIELRTLQRLGNGSLHVQVIINGKDVGMLYLTIRERDALLELIHKGPFKGEVEFLSDLVDEDEPDPFDE